MPNDCSALRSPFSQTFTGANDDDGGGGGIRERNRENESISGEGSRGRRGSWEEELTKIGRCDEGEKLQSRHGDHSVANYDTAYCEKATERMTNFPSLIIAKIG